MNVRKHLARTTSRLLAGLFAVQIVLTGFCMLSSQAHAMPMNFMPMPSMQAPMAATADGPAGHCSKAMHMNGAHPDSEHSGGCFHCDEPDQFVKVSMADLAPASLVFVAIAMLPEPAGTTVERSVVASLQPTGPPRSASLLFSTTQRIRV